MTIIMDKPMTEMEAAHLRLEIAEVKLENARRLIEVRKLHRVLANRRRQVRSLRKECIEFRKALGTEKVRQIKEAARRSVPDLALGGKL